MSISLDLIKKEAKIHEIPIVGVVTPRYFLELKEKLSMFVEEGFSFVFNNENIEEKCNPFKTMKACQAIVVLGLPYFVDSLEEQKTAFSPSKFQGELARTAWGEDYHRVFHRKMESLGSSLKKHYGNIKYQSYVDTGPLVDRFLAAKANLGYYGYNNLLYHPEYGSYVFYGYMLIDQEVEGALGQDEKIENKTLSLCKDCNRCIKICPGGAIEKPYRVRATRCISGILQMKGIMPDEDKKRIGKRIYGCDECQKVCPYNIGVRKSSIGTFLPGRPESHPDLIELLSLSNKEFKALYGSNASAWRGLRVLKRNALVALGNLMDPKAIPYIVPFLKDHREDLKDAAHWAVQKLKTIEKELF